METLHLIFGVIQKDEAETPARGGMLTGSLLCDILVF